MTYLIRMFRHRRKVVLGRWKGHDNGRYPKLSVLQRDHDRSHSFGECSSRENMSRQNMIVNPSSFPKCHSSCMLLTSSKKISKAKVGYELQSIDLNISQFSTTHEWKLG